MAKKGNVKDTDLGMSKICGELKALGKMSVKVGIPEGAGEQDGVPIAQYAAWNENGVIGKKGGWKIPPRPFIKGWVDNNETDIKTTAEKIWTGVTSGSMNADTAIIRLGEYGQDGIKAYIVKGNFASNAASTIKTKGSSKPLIDTGTMRNSIRYEVIKK
jgi:hypothetical protein